MPSSFGLRYMSSSCARGATASCKVLVLMMRISRSHHKVQAWRASVRAPELSCELSCSFQVQRPRCGVKQSTLGPVNPGAAGLKTLAQFF